MPNVSFTHTIRFFSTLHPQERFLFFQGGKSMCFAPRTPKVLLAFVLVALAQTGVWADEQSPDSGNQKQANPQSDGHGFQSKAREHNTTPNTCAEADLEKKAFQNVKTWSSFRKASLREAVFKESSFVGVDFRDAELEMARFVKCVLPAARLLGANCRQITFTNCSDICGADFSDGNLEMARFVNCRLPAARFVGAKCSRINFQNCSDVCGADFSDADLQMARFVNCRFPAARFVGANCSRANFANCGNACAADFSDANLEMSRFSNSELPAARFTGAKCKQINFNNCRITSSADFSDADLELATFTNCTLSTARFAGASFRATIFRRCNLSGADFRGVVFTECSLIDADLRGADLRGASLGNSLQGGQFDAKTLYDRTTQFPPGFDPIAKGLTLQ